MSGLPSILLLVAILCTIVVVHEAGHALIARLMGMRVSEFFVGMPFGPSVSFVGRRSGIRFGATLALFGGYTRIDGMAFRDDPRLALLLQLVNVRGCLSVGEAARVLSCDESQAADLLGVLEELGSVAGPSERGRRGAVEQGSAVFRTVDRDGQGRTRKDRGNMLRTSVVFAAGCPFDPGMSPDAFLAAEKARTYAGSSAFRRFLVLAAGPVFNLVFAFLLIVAFLMGQTFYTVPEYIHEVAAGSAAELAGVEPGDVLESINGQEVDGYWGLGEVLASLEPDEQVEVVVSRGSQTFSATVRLVDGKLGVTYLPVPYRMGLSEALRIVVPYVGQVAASVISLLNPSQVVEVLDSSTGVVGIAAMTDTAAGQGVWSVLLLMGMLSLSLSFMNLLPVPPLDGGKILLEAVSCVIGRPIPIWVQGFLSLVGMVLFFMLFMYMVVQDIFRFF